MAFDAPLFLDVGPDLARVDKGFTELLKDRQLWSEFIQNPIGVMLRIGIVTGVPPGQVPRANEIFYACLSNNELVQFILDRYGGHSLLREPAAVDEVRAGLEQGEIRNRPEAEFGVIDDLAQDQTALRTVFDLTLNDLNDRGLLPTRYDPSEIERIVNQTANVVSQRRSMADLPNLSSDAETYIQPLGAVVGPVAVAVVVAQVGAAATVAAAIAQPNIGSFDELARTAYAGDTDSVRALALLGRLFDLTAELCVHVQQLRNRPR